MQNLLRRVVVEPTTHFILLGAALFAAHAAMANGASTTRDNRRIVVSAEFARALNADAERRAGRAIDGAERAAQIHAFIEEEMLYREALELGLDRGDPVMRRRLTQKMEFLFEDPALATAPTDLELEAWLDAHPERYRIAARSSLVHVFFSRDRRGDRAHAEAENARAALWAGGTTDGVGDPLPLAGPIKGHTSAQLAAAFGPEFAAAVATLPVGAWSGPVPSTFGWHVVRVDSRSEARRPTLTAVRSRVQADLLVARKRDARRAVMQRLERRYEITIENPE
jgi:hypothetical protein